MKLQISPIRIVKDHLTVWYEHGENVDIVMELKNLTFAKDSLQSISAFHVLDHFFEKEAIQALSNWHACLKKGGTAYVVVDDFEYISRKFVGGDIGIDYLNEHFSHPMYFTKDNLIRSLSAAGFIENEMRIWYADVTDMFRKNEYELIIAATKI